MDNSFIKSKYLCHWKCQCR